jgi:hypothetical protein
MKHITLTADENLIKRARQIAKLQHKTLNVVFREWLEHFAAPPGDVQKFDALMNRLQYVKAGRSFSRDEMNRR